MQIDRSIGSEQLCIGPKRGRRARADDANERTEQTAVIDAAVGIHNDRTARCGCAQHHSVVERHQPAATHQNRLARRRSRPADRDRAEARLDQRKLRAGEVHRAGHLGTKANAEGLRRLEPEHRQKAVARESAAEIDLAARKRHVRRAAVESIHKRQHTAREQRPIRAGDRHLARVALIARRHGHDRAHITRKRNRLARDIQTRQTEALAKLRKLYAAGARINQQRPRDALAHNRCEREIDKPAVGADRDIGTQKQVRRVERDLPAAGRDIAKQRNIAASCYSKPTESRAAADRRQRGSTTKVECQRFGATQAIDARSGAQVQPAGAEIHRHIGQQRHEARHAGRVELRRRDVPAQLQPIGRNHSVAKGLSAEDRIATKPGKC